MINLGWYCRGYNPKIPYSSFGRETSISLNGYPTTMIKQDSRVYLTHPSHSQIYDSNKREYKPFQKQAHVRNDVMRSRQWSILAGWTRLL
jgi:hypothetical protein